METIIAEVLKLSPAIGVMLYIIWQQNKRAEARESWLESLYSGLQESIDNLTDAINKRM